MADTIFGQTALSAGIEGYKQAVDLGNYRTQEAAQTSLLSSKAEEAKIAVAQEKDKFATTLASRAALTSSALSTSNADMSSLSGQLKIYDNAIKASSDRPEIVEALQDKRTEVLRRAAQGGLDNNILRQEKAQQVYDAVNDAFTNPDTGIAQLTDMIKTADDPTTRSRLMGIQAILQDKHPMRNAQGQLVPYSQLSPEEQDKFQNDIKTNLAPTAEQKAMIAVSKLRIEDAKQQDLAKYRAEEEDRKRKEDAARQQGDANKLAETARHNRVTENIASTKSKFEVSWRNAKTDNDRTQAMVKADKEYPALIANLTAQLAKTEKKTKGVLGTGFMVDDASIEAAKNLREELDTVKQNYADAKAMYSTKDAAVKAVKEKEAKPTSAVPSRPADVPTNAQWSPSKKSWWWQENGTWKSK